MFFRFSFGFHPSLPTASYLRLHGDCLCALRASYLDFNGRFMLGLQGFKHISGDLRLPKTSSENSRTKANHSFYGVSLSQEEENYQKWWIYNPKTISLPIQSVLYLYLFPVFYQFSSSFLVRIEEKKN